MGRGRSKAKETKVARDLKYSNREMDLEKLTQEIESGEAPFDQQQKLQIDFIMKRVEHLEGAHEKIRNDIMDLIHSNSKIPQQTRSQHEGH